MEAANGKAVVAALTEDGITVAAIVAALTCVRKLRLFVCMGRVFYTRLDRGRKHFAADLADGRGSDPRPSASPAVSFTVSCLCPYRRHPFEAVVRLDVLVSAVVFVVVVAPAAPAALSPELVLYELAVAEVPLVAVEVVPAVAVVLRRVHHAAAAEPVEPDVRLSLR